MDKTSNIKVIRSVLLSAFYPPPSLETAYMTNIIFICINSGLGKTVTGPGAAAKCRLRCRAPRLGQNT